MTGAQKQVLDSVVRGWTRCGYKSHKVYVYAALDSDDVLVVADGDPPHAARINPLGSSQVGPAASPGMGTPLKPLAKDHPNYAWENQGGTEARP